MFMKKLSRGSFLLATIFCFIEAFAGTWPSETSEFIIKVNALDVRAWRLTNWPGGDYKLYQTKRSWSYDKKYILFLSDRLSQNNFNRQARKLHALDLLSGEIFSFGTPGVTEVDISLSDNSNDLFYAVGSEGGYSFYRFNLDNLKISLIEQELPLFSIDRGRGVLVGGIAYDHILQKLYFSLWRKVSDKEISEIYSYNFSDQKIFPEFSVDFKIGHLQVDPGNAFVFCHETGGDARQRIWYRPYAGSTRPLFIESSDEWITHETLPFANHVLYNKMAHLPELSDGGIYLFSLRANTTRFIGQGDGRGYWHSSASADGKWLVADDFDGNIFVISLIDLRRFLIMTGNDVTRIHAHPSISNDGRHILVQTTKFSLESTPDLVLLENPYYNDY